MLARIIKRLRLLERFPALGAPMHGAFADYRSTTVGAFRIVYRLVGERRIEVAYVRHARRAPLA